MQIETEDHRVDTSATNQTNYISTNSIPQSYFFICLMSLHTMDMFAMFLIIYGKMQHGFCCCSEVNVSVLVLCNHTHQIVCHPTSALVWQRTQTYQSQQNEGHCGCLVLSWIPFGTIIKRLISGSDWILKSHKYQSLQQKKKENPVLGTVKIVFCKDN